MYCGISHSFCLGFVKTLHKNNKSKSDEKLRAEKDNTEGAPAPALKRVFKCIVESVTLSAWDL